MSANIEVLAKKIAGLGKHELNDIEYALRFPKSEVSYAELWSEESFIKEAARAALACENPDDRLAEFLTKLFASLLVDDKWQCEKCGEWFSNTHNHLCVKEV